MVTIFQNIYAEKPFYTTVDQALERIKTGKSKARIEELRDTLDAGKADSLKRQLPSVCFSGKFIEREDEKIIEHSGFIVLDFDKVQDVDVKMADICQHPFVYAAWVSPRGNGIKALCKIADGKKHREHFEAIKELFPSLDEKGNHKFKLLKSGEKKWLYDVDDSGKNESRVCYESWDGNIYINKKATAFTKTKKVEWVDFKEQVKEESEIFTKLLKWLANKGGSFVTGERNLYIFKLASSCCRFGIDEHIAASLILTEHPASNDFTRSECIKAIQSAYRANRKNFGNAAFERGMLVEKITRQEVVFDNAIFDESIRPKDVIYGCDVKDAAFSIYKNGYEKVLPVNIPALDERFKLKRGEITLLSGIGNYGKSAFWKWYMIVRVVQFGEKFACFVPEDNPAGDYYHELTEILLGCDLTPDNPHKPKDEVYLNAYDFLDRHIFFIYPKELAPTPEYIKERFLEMIVKEKVDGVLIDPFNQMTNDYGKAGGRSDKYLETILGDFSRFAQTNSVYFVVIAHPHSLVKGKDGNYPCPDVFDLNDGAMWNNKMDNIIIYHRPFMQTDPNNPLAEFHSKKIRKQRIVGKKGFTLFDYDWKSRRFYFDGIDYLQRLLNEKGYTFQKEQASINFKPKFEYKTEDFSEGLEAEQF